MLQGDEAGENGQRREQSDAPLGGRDGLRQQGEREPQQDGE